MRVNKGEVMYQYSLIKKILIISGLLVVPFIVFMIFGNIGVYLEMFSLFVGIPVSLFLMIKKPKNGDSMLLNSEYKTQAKLLKIEKNELKAKLKAEKLAYDREHFNVKFPIKYLGGGDIGYEKHCTVVITNEIFTYDIHSINISDIKRTGMETQSQISSRLTATRLLAFGLFALAAPKKTKTVEKFLTIDFEGDVPGTLVFIGPSVTAVITSIRAAQSYQAERRKAQLVTE